MRRLRLLSIMLAIPLASAMADELGGSRASIRHQHEVAEEHDFTFLKTAAQVRDFVEKERLVEVVPNADLLVDKVSFPYTRPIIRTFIERLAAQFRRATGDPLVVTSLTRPLSLQPRNASPFSVHPAGMAVDFRVPQTSEQRAWLEQTLLSLEDRGLLDVTRERHPPHYHVAVFPDEYEGYAEKLIAREAANARAAAAFASVVIASSARRVVPADLSVSSPSGRDAFEGWVVAIAFSVLLLAVGAGVRLTGRTSPG
jgi:hypothetical protein